MDKPLYTFEIPYQAWLILPTNIWNLESKIKQIILGNNKSKHIPMNYKNEMKQT